MNQNIETIIVGGGQAGLSTSYYLKQRGRPHLILEQADLPANAWRNDRWDSFTLVTPNWSFRLPGAEYQGSAPHGFMPRAEIVERFEQYIDLFQLPIHYRQRVTSIEQIPEGQGYLVKIEEAKLRARNVVIAVGLYQRPRIPSFSADLSAHINQLHSGQYRNPQSLPPGAVLVVGSGQSGCQIAEELYQSGRRVYLCVGNAARVPRHYRGKDIYEWMNLSGFIDRTVDRLPSPKARFAANPQVSGRDGGHALNLHKFARDGVVLVGHLQGGRDHKIWLAPDLKESLAKTDKAEVEFIKLIDVYIAQSGMNAPSESLPEMRDGYESREFTELDLQSAGVTSLIWAMGYLFDFNFVRLPIFDSDGYPFQYRGVTDYPGLYFVGLPWLFKQKSGHLFGVGEDADFIASEIDRRLQ